MKARKFIPFVLVASLTLLLLAWIVISQAYATQVDVSNPQQMPVAGYLSLTGNDLGNNSLVVEYATDITPTLTFTTYLPFVSKSSPVSQFIGHWTNENPNTGGITRVEIRSESNTIFVHMWGKCHPTDCDWGETTTDISDANDGVLSLTWTFSFKVETQQVSVLSDGRLQVVGHVHYTDDSGRPDRDYTEYYIRE